MAASYDLNVWEWDEENDLKNFAVWVSDIVHDQPMPPLVLYNFGYQHGMAFWYCHEKLSIPEAKGWLWRFVDGWPRLALVEPKPEETEYIDSVLTPETLEKSKGDTTEKDRPLREACRDATDDIM